MKSAGIGHNGDRDFAEYGVERGVNSESYLYVVTEGSG